jgi:hypothetical protein
MIHIEQAHQGKVFFLVDAKENQGSDSSNEEHEIKDAAHVEEVHNQGMPFLWRCQAVRAIFFQSLFDFCFGETLGV